MLKMLKQDGNAIRFLILRSVNAIWHFDADTASAERVMRLLVLYVGWETGCS